MCHINETEDHKESLESHFKQLQMSIKTLSKDYKYLQKMNEKIIYQIAELQHLLTVYF